MIQLSDEEGKVRQALRARAMQLSDVDEVYGQALRTRAIRLSVEASLPPRQSLLLSSPTSLSFQANLACGKHLPRLASFAI